MSVKSIKSNTNQPTPFPDEWVIPPILAKQEPKGSLIVQKQVGKPAFFGEGVECFTCHQCGETLINGYSKRYFVALHLKCAKCGQTSITQAWLEDEPLARNRQTFDAGVHHVDQFRQRAQTTTAHEEWRVSERLRPNLNATLDPVGDTEGLKQAHRILQSIGERNFDSQLKKARNALSRGHDASVGFPLAAAYLECERIVATKTANLTTKTYEEIVLLNTTLLFILQWQQHPLAKNVLGALMGSEFHHTLVMLGFATSLAQQNIEFGFLITRGDNGRAPDMFINISPRERFAVEIKAPERFQWPKFPSSDDDAKSIVLRASENAKGQIKTMKNGILVIGATFGRGQENERLDISKKFDNKLAVAVQAALDCGGVSSTIAEVKTIALNLCPSVDVHPSGWKKSDIGGLERSYKNPKYAERP